MSKYRQITSDLRIQLRGVECQSGLSAFEVRPSQIRSEYRSIKTIVKHPSIIAYCSHVARL